MSISNGGNRWTWYDTLAVTILGSALIYGLVMFEMAVFG